MKVKGSYLQWFPTPHHLIYPQHQRFPMTKKEFIDELNEARSSYLYPSQAHTAAKLLNTVAVDIYSESQRFLFELIQNADDAAHGPGNEVHFEFLPGCLIACHKGKPFTEADIDAITDAGASTKAADNTKTGYKGIGFKSVFGKSKCVTICSDGYQFRFDKAANKKDYPWQIIPIWMETSELPAEVAQFIARNEYAVYTCLELADAAELQQEMGELLKSPQLLLFLRNITQISVAENARQLYSIRKQTVRETGAYRQVQLFSQEQLISTWLLQTFEQIPLPEEVRAQLEDDEKTPEKLKSATVTEVAFAAKLDNGLLVPLGRDESLLFTYLPTKVKEFNFPFLVNGTFLTNASREALHEDAAWNRWHFELLATKLLDWLELLLATDHRLDILSLLPAPSAYAGRELRNRFDNSLAEGIVQKRIALTTALTPKQPREVVLDKTGLASQSFIDPAALLTFVEALTGRRFGPDSFVHPEFKQAAALVPYGMAVLERDNVEAFFKSAAFRASHTVAANAELIAYLKQVADNDREGIWFETIRELPFIYDTAGTLRNPENGVCFPSEVEAAASTELGEIPVIHPDVYQAIAQTPRLMEWLKKLGVKRPSELAYVTNVLIPGIKDKSLTFITLDNYLPVTHYLFRLDKEGALTDELFESLRELKVKTTRADDSFEEAQFCYLANRYRPELALENVIDDLPFIGDEYLTNGAREEEWYRFFKKLKAKDRIELEAITANNSLVPLRSITQPAWVSLAATQARQNAPASHFGFDDHNVITGLLLPSFLNLTLSNSKYSKLFWTTLLTQESDPRRLMLPLVFRYGAGRGRNGFSVPIDGYFPWFLKEQACIPTSTGQLLKASDVWLNTKEFKDIASRYLPVFDSTSFPNQAWRAILNFRNKLETKDYLLILSKIAAGERAKFSRADQKTLDLVYQALSGIAADSTPEDRDLIQEWAATGSLVTSAHTFEPPAALLWIRVEGFADMAGKMKSLFIPENVERASPGFPTLLELFGVPIVDSYTPNVADARVDVGLKNKLLEILPFLAALNEKKRYIDLEVAYPDLKQQLLQTAFYSASAINLFFTYQDKEFHGAPLKVLREKQDFYFTGDWRSPLNKYLLLPALSTLLDLTGFDQELRLLLELSTEELFEWLETERIDPQTILARCQAVDARTAYQLPLPVGLTEYRTPAPLTASPNVPPPVYTGQPFQSVTAVEDVELGTATIGTATTTSSTWFSSSTASTDDGFTPPERTYTALENEEDRMAVGRWAEAYVSRKLVQERERFTHVEWANEFGESYKPYDFKVMENGQEKYIEVKGTPSPDKDEAYFSTSEWRLLFEQQQHYAIYRVFHVFQPAPRLAVIEHPSAQLIQGDLLPAKIALRL